MNEPRHPPGSHPAFDAPVDGPVVRVIAGLGDLDLERRILPVLRASGTVQVVERVLSAETLPERAAATAASAVLVADGLHRLSPALLAHLAAHGLVLVGLARRPEPGLWPPGATVLPVDAAPERILDALHATTGSRAVAPVLKVMETRTTGMPGQTDDALPAGDGAEAAGGIVLAVTGGSGSPGCTTLALGLAAALGAVVPALLVDADLSGSGVVPYLDATPARNLFMLAHAAPLTPEEWAEAVATEVQPVGARSPSGHVLCGVPKPELRAAITPDFLSRLLAVLRRHYRYIVLDLGRLVLDGGPGSAVQQVGLQSADQVLVTVAGDLAGLRSGQLALRRLGSLLGTRTDRVALVLNRYRRRDHYHRDEIAWALETPVAGVIPEDVRHVQQAIAARQLVIFRSRSTAAQALIALAERLHHRQLHLPPEPEHRDWYRRLWQALPRPMRGRRTAASVPTRDASLEVTPGVVSGDGTVPQAVAVKGAIHEEV